MTWYTQDMSQQVNFNWPQGEDLSIQLAYKEGPAATSAKVLNLSTGYSLRMDIFLPNEVLVSITSPENVLLKATSPNIEILLDRELTLPGGVIEEKFPAIQTFSYDVFLRNTVTDRQVKILRGNLKIERSGTLWE